jgi:hypothetical protein
MGLMRNLGKMVGHIRSAVVKPVPKAPANPPASAPPPFHTATPHAHTGAPRVVAQRVQEATLETPQGPVLLRRTTTDEVIVPTSPPPPPR